MNTEDAFRLFCDGRMSVQDIYALLGSMGHSRNDLVAALGAVMDDGFSVRWTNSSREGIAEIFVWPELDKQS